MFQRTCLFLLLLGTMLSSAAYAYSGCLPKDSTLPVSYSNGAYLEGELHLADANAGGVSLGIFDDRGYRQLIDQGGAREAFRHLMHGDAVFRLSAEMPLCYTLTLTQSAIAAYPPPVENAWPESPRLQALQKALTKDGDAAINDFWKERTLQGSPLVETLPDGVHLATFLYRGALHNVGLWGAPDNDHGALERLPGTDLWYKTYRVAPDLRLAYKLAPDAPVLQDLSIRAESAGEQAKRRQRTAILSVTSRDPLNPHVFMDASLLELPKARRYPRASFLRGKVSGFSHASRRLGNARRLWFYQSPNPYKRQPIWLYLLDGEVWQGRMDMAGILDRLYSDGRLPPIIALFIANPDHSTRAEELVPNAAFADMFVNELIPLVAQKTGEAPVPARSVIAGASYGGLAAAYIAHRYPMHVGNVISMSGSFWWHPKNSPRQNYIARLYASDNAPTLRWHISAGRYETARNAAEDGILDTSRALADVLRQRGHHVVWREYNGGHDYALWENALPDGLLALFGQDGLR